MNIPPRKANSTDFRPLEGKVHVYFKRSDLCRFFTVFSMHMECCMVHNMTTTTLVTMPELCSRFYRQASAAAASSNQLFCEGGRECC